MPPPPPRGGNSRYSLVHSTTIYWCAADQSQWSQWVYLRGDQSQGSQRVRIYRTCNFSRGPMYSPTDLDRVLTSADLRQQLRPLRQQLGLTDTA
eukprot:1116466-Prorocentrum_minimum.AAC.1